MTTPTDEAKGITTQDEEAQPGKCPSERAGIKTTEFWLAAGMLLLAGYLMTKGKDELGSILAGIACTVYTGFRGIVKAKLAQTAGVLLFVFMTGCSTPGYVRADAIEELVQKVTERHDAYVTADPAYAKRGEAGRAEQATHLRSAEILRMVVMEAMKAGQDKKAIEDAESKRVAEGSK